MKEEDYGVKSMWKVKQALSSSQDGLAYKGTMSEVVRKTAGEVLEMTGRQKK